MIPPEVLHVIPSETSAGILTDNLAGIPAELFPEISTGTSLGMYAEISVGISPIFALKITPWIDPGVYL